LFLDVLAASAHPPIITVVGMDFVAVEMLLTQHADRHRWSPSG
jgi:hypothetical protein